MFTSLTSKLLPSFVIAATLITLVGLFIVPPAGARIARNTIDPVALVTDDGRHLVVTGPLACTAGEKVYLRVTVTQRATGAVAEGHTRFLCEGETETQQWEVHAVTHGKARFAEGSAWAVALARTTERGDTTDAHQDRQRGLHAHGHPSTERGETTDAHQWLVNITLVGE